jgi:quinol monooxygenase YgiN
MHAITLDAGDDVAAIIQALRSELRDPTKPLSLLVRFEVEKAHGEKVEAAFGAAIPPTLNEPGCVVFNLNRDSRDPGRFVVYEQWRNLADLEAHLRKDYVSRLRTELNKLIAGAPEFQVLLPATRGGKDLSSRIKERPS